jgi:hypothetical protein
MLTPFQARWLLFAVAILFVLQLPRALVVQWPTETPPQEQLALMRRDPAAWWRQAWQDWRDDPPCTAQRAVLLRIDEMDARCRTHRIDRATARAALGTLHVPGSQPGDNGWDFLRGSADPRPLTVDEARRLLTEPGP